MNYIMFDEEVVKNLEHIKSLIKDMKTRFDHVRGDVETREILIESIDRAIEIIKIKQDVILIKEDKFIYEISDCYSGGYLKTDYHYWYIIADCQFDAEEIFEQKTGYNMDDETCECCGYDFWIRKVDEIPKNKKFLGEDARIIVIGKEE